jgi:hypothetical protein
MKPMIAIFRFTIGNGQSISPETLQKIWAKASRTSDVGVGRVAGLRQGEKPTYSLYGRQSMPNLAEIEKRLHTLFDEVNLHASVVCVDRV